MTGNKKDSPTLRYWVGIHKAERGEISDNSSVNESIGYNTELRRQEMNRRNLHSTKGHQQDPLRG